jgi:short-subunit dehydrogenase
VNNTQINGEQDTLRFVLYPGMYGIIKKKDGGKSMKALVTGASSGIGYEMAKYLSNLGYDIIAVARDEGRLKKLQSEASGGVQIIPADLAHEKNCMDLHARVRDQDIDILINNAGFGLFGDFLTTGLECELSMIHTNISALHILTKLFYMDMAEKNKGTIMNVASIAGFMPGPMMAGYYASKAYVIRLTQAIREEILANRSNVHVCLLCPGPVDTRFNQTAEIEKDLHGLTAPYVAKYAVDRMLKGKFMIVPGGSIKAARVLAKVFPESLAAKGAYYMQRKKS